MKNASLLLLVAAFVVAILAVAFNSGRYAGVSVLLLTAAVGLGHV